MIFTIFFFFSSRRRHTRSTRDWSSDVCSSNLREGELLVEKLKRAFEGNGRSGLVFAPPPAATSSDKSWWPASHAIQGDAWKIVGLFLGHEAGRYRAASHLSNALRVPPEL